MQYKGRKDRQLKAINVFNIKHDVVDRKYMTIAVQ
jgi:hypothetical protein